MSNIYKDLPGQSEAQLQQKIVFWYWNEYPLLRGTLCYNNNNSIGGQRGRSNSSLGTIKGRSDLSLYLNKKALMIELKTERGYQSKAQKDWQELLELQGFEYIIIRSLDSFKKLIRARISEME